MSLQLAAQHLAARGRGPDSTLVHMAPSEVKALQAVAKAHGGSLTVNPDTGLPEAGFLSSILPTIAGVGLSMIPGVGPLMAAGLVGGGTALATGSLGKGLMAGLGAYGGAGIGGSLATAGATQGLAAASAEATAAGQAEAARQLADANMMAKYQALGKGFSPEEVALSAREFGSNQMTPAAQAALVKPSFTSSFDNMVSGVKGLGNEAGRDEFMKQIGGAKGLFKSGYAAALPMMLSQSGQGARPPSAGGGSNPYEYDFTPGYKGPYTDVNGGTRYFDPRYVLRKADGGETYADGGGTGMTGQSDEYYRYLMGLSPSSSYTVAAPTAPAASAASKVAPKSSDAYYNYLMGMSPYPSYMDASDPSLMSRAPEANFAEGYKPSLYEKSLARLTPAELGTHYAYLDASRQMMQSPGQGGPSAPNGADNDDVGLGQGINAAISSQATLDSDSSSGPPGTPGGGGGGTGVNGSAGDPNSGNGENGDTANAKRGGLMAFAEGGAATPSDDYYRYLMGMSAYPAYMDPSDPSLMSKAPAANFAQGYKPSLYEQSLSRLTPDELATHYAGLNAKTIGQDGGELPEPANPDNMFTEDGQLNLLASALASLGQNFPVLANPSLGLLGAAISNAVQGQNMIDLNNSLNQALGGQGSGIPQPGQAGFAAALPGAIISQSSLASSQANDEMNASLNAAIANSAAQTAAASSQANDEVNASLNANATANAVGADNDDAAIGDAAAAADAAANSSNPDSLKRGGISAAFANGGYNLGDYSDGGRLLRGPGDGVSDSIPASIADKRPARLADGEFVVPARIVSELGNGSTEAGARKLYAMMDRVQQGRAKTTGKGRVAVNSRSDKYLPA
jgi:hypothetical protein